ncbi:MAG: arsenate reductase (glutaredoxin) [Bacteroidales bacterium]|jgi:arsenate reductase (glutaredoxin)
MLQIYHNPRCKISRKVLEEIRKTSNEIEVIEYLKKVPSIKELKILLAKLNLEPSQIVRTSENLFKEKFKGKNFTDEEWIQILYENPILIERPIVVRNNKAILCRPPEKVEEII